MGVIERLLFGDACCGAASVDRELCWKDDEVEHYQESLQSKGPLALIGERGGALFFPTAVSVSQRAYFWQMHYYFC